MKIAYFIAIILSVAHAHTYFSSLVVNGQALPENDCLRPQFPGGGGNYRNSPLSDVKSFPNGLTSANMTCGFLPWGGQSANRRCTIAAGSTVGLQWYHNGPSAGDDYIDGTHKGPTMAYLVKSDSGTPTNGWFKIYEDGYDPVAKTWASTDKLKANKGVFNVVIPSDILPGKYLLRGEIIGCHECDRKYGAQPYAGCAEIEITGSGTVAPSSTVSIPGVYGINDPGIMFDIYSPYTSYTIPGPRPYRAGSQTSGNTNSGTSSGTISGTNSGTVSGSSPSGSNSSPSSCGDASACIAVCGAGKVSICSCENGNPRIECATNSGMKASFAILSVVLAMIVSF